MDVQIEKNMDNDTETGFTADVPNGQNMDHDTETGII